MEEDNVKKGGNRCGITCTVAYVNTMAYHSFGEKIYQEKRVDVCRPDFSLTYFQNLARLLGRKEGTEALVLTS
eukprot:scaffold410844_cov31-Attheya_sp.AAC.1